MKNIIYLLSISFLVFSCGQSKPVAENVQDQKQNDELVEAVEAKKEKTEATVKVPQKIEWLDFETAIDRNKKEQKYIFIDLYTDWCGWCKKMDASTFVDPKVITYMNTHFYAVKMNAESKDAIVYKEHIYEYQKYGNKGYNTLAVNLLDARMSFPTFVVLGKKETKKGKIMGYKNADQLVVLLENILK